MPPKSTICLAMMVHNEADKLERVYDLLKDRIDAAVIFITPPYEDDSEEMAKKIFQGNIPWTYITKQPGPEFKQSYSEARQRLLDTARAQGECDYVLMIDPDSPVIGRIPRNLKAAVYQIEHRTEEDMNFYYPHLFRHDQPITWAGAVHELPDFYYLGIPVHMEDLKSCYIDARVAGATEARGREQYIPWLLREHEENPLIARTVFNLGQAYHMVGDLEDAIVWYKKRLEVKGTPEIPGHIEEEYYSLFKIGLLSRDLGRFADAELWLMRAFCFRPIRREAFRELIRLYYGKGMTDLAHVLFEWYMMIPPCDDILLVQYNGSVEQEPSSVD